MRKGVVGVDWTLSFFFAELVCGCGVVVRGVGCGVECDGTADRDCSGAVVARSFAGRSNVSWLRVDWIGAGELDSPGPVLSLESSSRNL